MRLVPFLALLFTFSVLSACSESKPAPPSEAAATSAATPTVFNLRPGDSSLKMPVGRLDTEGVTTTGKAGALVTGPSTTLAAGKYVARWYGVWGQSQGSAPPAVYDVYWDGAGPFPSTNPKAGSMLSSADGVLAEVPFDIPSAVSNFQTRAWVTPEHLLTITRIEVLRR